MQKIKKSNIISVAFLALILTFSSLFLTACDKKEYEVLSISIEKQYDGTNVSPEIKTDFNSPYKIEYAEKGVEVYSSQAPINAGNYTAKITFYENDGFNELVKYEDFTISKRPVYISGLIVEDKVADSTQTATILGTASLENVVDGDDVVIDGQITAHFSTAEAGRDISVVFDTINLIGEDSGNYEVIYPTLTANIYSTNELVTVTYVAETGGQIQGTVSQVLFEGGQTTEVTAIANNGYTFDGWSDGFKNATRQDTNITSSITITAQFSPIVDENELDLFIIAGQSNSVCYTGNNSASLDILNSPDYPENIFEYRPSLNNIQQLQNPVGEGVSAAGVSQGYATGGTWFSSMAKEYNEQTGRSVVILPAGNPGVTTSTYYNGGSNFNMLMEKYRSFKTWIDSQVTYTLGRIILVWHQGESGTGDGSSMSVATKKVFDDIKTAINAEDSEHQLDQVFFSRISNNQACDANTTKLYNQEFVSLNNTSDYVLVAPNALQYYFLDQFADEHHYDMNACNDLGAKIGSDIAYYYLNEREKPNVVTYEMTQTMGYGEMLNGLNVVNDTLIAFDDTVDKQRTWLLANSTYNAYATFENIELDYSTDFELEVTLKLGDNLVGVSAGNVYPILGSIDDQSSISIGSNKVAIKSSGTVYNLAHNVSPMIYRPSSERICKEINHNTYRIVKQGANLTLFVNDVQASTTIVNENFSLNLNLFGLSGSTYLQGVVSDFNFTIN